MFGCLERRRAMCDVIGEDSMMGEGTVYEVDACGYAWRYESELCRRGGYVCDTACVAAESLSLSGACQCLSCGTERFFINAPASAV